MTKLYTNLTEAEVWAALRSDRPDDQDITFAFLKAVEACEKELRTTGTVACDSAFYELAADQAVINLTWGPNDEDGVDPADLPPDAKMIGPFSIVRTSGSGQTITH